MLDLDYTSQIDTGKNVHRKCNDPERLAFKQTETVCRTKTLLGGLHPLFMIRGIQVS
jgi:hypothetical protein